MTQLARLRDSTVYQPAGGGGVTGITVLHTGHMTWGGAFSVSLLLQSAVQLAAS